MKEQYPVLMIIDQRKIHLTSSDEIHSCNMPFVPAEYQSLSL